MDNTSMIILLGTMCEKCQLCSFCNPLLMTHPQGQYHGIHNKHNLSTMIVFTVTLVKLMLWLYWINLVVVSEIETCTINYLKDKKCSNTTQLSTPVITITCLRILYNLNAKLRKCMISIMPSLTCRLNGKPLSKCHDVWHITFQHAWHIFNYHAMFSKMYKCQNMNPSALIQWTFTNIAMIMIAHLCQTLLPIWSAKKKLISHKIKRCHEKMSTYLDSSHQNTLSRLTQNFFPGLINPKFEQISKILCRKVKLTLIFMTHVTASKVKASCRSMRIGVSTCQKHCQMLTTDQKLKKMSFLHKIKKHFRNFEMQNRNINNGELLHQKWTENKHAKSGIKRYLFFKFFPGVLKMGHHDQGPTSPMYQPQTILIWPNH